MDTVNKLSPWPIRLSVYAALVVVAIAAIRLIDVRAMTLQREFEQERQTLLNAHREPPDRAEHADHYGSKTTTIQFSR
jgi:hypothetical protein